MAFLVPLVAVETHGSNCLYQSLSLNEGPFVGDVESRPPPEGTAAQYCSEHEVTIAHISKLTSRATSLGASSPSGAIVKMALQKTGGVKSVCVPDEMAMQATALFAGECSRFCSGWEDLTLLCRGPQDSGGAGMRSDACACVQAHAVP